MTDTNNKKHRVLLQKIARRVMLERGLLPDFSRQALAELDGIHEQGTDGDASAPGFARASLVFNRQR